MFFSLSKILWFLIQPMTIVLILCLVAAGAVYFRRNVTAMVTIILCSMIVGLFGFTTFGSVLLKPLEERFARMNALPDHIDGIIVLGGYMNGEINATRKGTELNSAADRVIETMRLAHIYPNVKIVVTGGEGSYFVKSKPDADSTETLFAAFGLDNNNVIYEANSRNTIENAKFTHELLGPQDGQKWLLITSAFHMPRSVGVFRRAGFDVIPWPVDYKTVPDTEFGFYFQNANEAFSRTSTALHEWLGLVVYWWSGETDQLFPAP